MSHKTKIGVIALSMAIALAPVQANATWLEDFYNSAGAAANVTAPRAIAGQGIVGFSGGGMTWRVPNKTLNPFQITPPSFRAGCGGIDYYLGSYSFVNKEAFVQALRNFGQAAVGYFFQLALRSMSPEIAATLDVINDLANRMNIQGLNSCESARKLVDSTFGDMMKGTIEESKNRYVAVGEQVDQFAAGLGLKDSNFSGVLNKSWEAKYNKGKSSVTESDLRTGDTPPEFNAVWLAMQLGNSSADDAEKQIAMSVIGPTWIYRSNNDPNDGTSGGSNGKEWTITFEQLRGAANGGIQDYKIYTCDTSVHCLNPSASSVPMRSFSAIARDVLVKLQTRITTRSATPVLTTLEESVLKLSSVPLARVVSLSTGSGAGAAVAQAMMDDLAEYAGTEAAYNFVDMHLRELERMAALLQGKGNKIAAADAEKMMNRAAELRRTMNTTIATLYKQKGNPFEKIDQLDRIEKSMYASLNRNLAANLKFSNRN